ncbi:hypothetical protein HYT25_01950 [Candidatus Pacearchaeota archaeon]|nr:hypothetical protein [Candidatus Pacearchaeota archaeon]
MEEGLTSLNIAVIPPLEIRNKAIEFSEGVSLKFLSEFVLNNEDKIPHISLYQAGFPLRNIGKIEDAVREVSG